MSIIDPLVLIAAVIVALIAMKMGLRSHRTIGAMNELEAVTVDGRPRSDVAILHRSKEEMYSSVGIAVLWFLLFLGVYLVLGKGWNPDNQGLVQYLMQDPMLFITPFFLIIFIHTMRRMGQLAGQFFVITEQGIEERRGLETKMTIKWEEITDLWATGADGRGRVAEVFVAVGMDVMGIPTSLKNVDRFFEMALRKMPPQCHGSWTYAWIKGTNGGPNAATQ